jgi:uncharacterized membrane protein
MNTRSLIAPASVTIAVCSLLSASAGASVTFTPLGFLNSDTPTTPTALSADGRVAVGYSQLAPGQGTRAVRWVNGGPIENLTPSWPLGGASNTSAYAVSGNGSVISGNQQNGGPNQGWLRREGTGFSTLPSSGSAFPLTLSDDGLTSFGFDGDGAVAWRSGTRTVIGRPAGATFIAPTGNTPDGSAFVGAWRNQSSQLRGVRWSEATGLVDLGVPAGTLDSQATGISADGSIVVGTARTAPPQFANRAWTLDASGYRFLTGPGGAQTTLAAEMTPDGRVIVGSYSLTNTGNPIPCVWVNGTPIDVQALLLANGANLNGWDLDSIIDVSDDGLTVLGNATRPSGAGNFQSAAWIATIPSPGAPIVVAGAALLASRRRRRHTGRA